MIPIDVPHKTICDVEIEGYNIPKGTTIHANLWTLHEDEDFWGDPYTFRPERFLDDKGQFLSPDTDERKHVMMFGNGPRVCAGRLFALYRLFLWIVTLVQHFDILPEDPNNIPSENVNQFNMVGGLLLPPSYKAKFVPRA